jgi:hypothetical protein
MNPDYHPSNPPPTKSKSNLEHPEKDVDIYSGEYKDNDEDGYGRNAVNWMMMVKGRRRRMDTLSLGGIRLISTTSASPLISATPQHTLLSSSNTGAHRMDIAAAVDKFKDNKWVTVKAMVRYAVMVKMRRAVVRWSRVSLASLFRRRRFILLRYYPLWKVLAHQQRFTRAAFLSRIAVFLRRETLQFIWNKIKAYTRDNKSMRIISKRNVLCMQKQVLSGWISILAYTKRARSSLVPLNVWAEKISVKFSFYYWRISVSNAIGLNNLALMKGSIKIWRNMASASQCYNRNLARRVMLALRKLLWVRGEMRRALKRSRGISLLLATRLDHIGKIAIRRSFDIWVMRLGLNLGPINAKGKALKRSLSSSFQGSKQHPNRDSQGYISPSEPFLSLSKEDKSSCSVTASSIKQISPSPFTDRSGRLEAFEIVEAAPFEGDDEEEEDEEEHRILNSSLSLRYAALLRSKG